jgi:NTP pyrophosphatase (non-canonical NTP hydrolase)
VRELTDKIAQQNAAREQWVGTDTPASLAHHIADEAHELLDAVENYDYLPEGVYGVVSELGDVLYLALKLCHDLGIDPAQAVELKLMRNAVKYPDYALSNGWDYDTAATLSRALWTMLGGDKKFYEWHSQQYPLEEP